MTGLRGRFTEGALLTALLASPAAGQGITCGPITMTQNETTVVNDAMFRCIVGSVWARVYELSLERPEFAGKPVALTCVEFAIAEHTALDELSFKLNIWLDPTHGQPDVASRVLLWSAPLTLDENAPLPAWFNVPIPGAGGCGLLIPADSQIIVEIDNLDESGNGMRPGRNGGDDPYVIPPGEGESRSSYFLAPSCSYNNISLSDYSAFGGDALDVLASHHFVQVLHFQDVKDCNANGQLDACELTASFGDASGQLSPIGLGSPVSHTVPSPPQAIGDVTLSFQAIADLASSTRTLDVFLNGVSFGSIFVTTGSFCPGTPDTDEIVLSASQFNALVAGVDLDIDIQTFDGVFGTACAGTSWVSVDLDYFYAPDVDGNDNGVPDECDLARGDGNLDGVVNVIDLLNLLAKWGACPAPCPEDALPDGFVNVVDLLRLLAGWG